MYEVEVKVPADLDRVRERLEALGAEARGPAEQVDTYYDHPTRTFAATDEALRVRRETDRATAGRTGADEGRAAHAAEAGTAASDNARAVLTYKGPKVDAASKTRREVEVAVGDADAADALLEALGFGPAAEVRKARERFDLGSYTVTLDDVDGLGAYVEVEARGDEEAVEGLREGAYELLDRLGLDPADQVRASYLELLEATPDAPTGDTSE